MSVNPRVGLELRVWFFGHSSDQSRKLTLDILNKTLQYCCLPCSLRPHSALLSTSATEHECCTSANPPSWVEKHSVCTVCYCSCWLTHLSLRDASSTFHLDSTLLLRQKTGDLPIISKDNSTDIFSRESKEFRSGFMFIHYKFLSFKLADGSRWCK